MRSAQKFQIRTVTMDLEGSGCPAAIVSMRERALEVKVNNSMTVEKVGRKLNLGIGSR